MQKTWKAPSKASIEKTQVRDWQPPPSPVALWFIAINDFNGGVVTVAHNCNEARIRELRDFYKSGRPMIPHSVFAQEALHEWEAETCAACAAIVDAALTESMKQASYKAQEVCVWE